VALVVLALGVAMIILDGTVVNVALPAMVKDLDLSTTDAEWVTAAYSLTFASLLILNGRLADRFGRRLLFAIGIVVFVLASVLVAMSSNSIEIIGARALQGIGGAMIFRPRSRSSTPYSSAAHARSPSRCGARRSAAWQPSAHWSAAT
jgi:MFS family permease